MAKPRTSSASSNLGRGATTSASTITATLPAGVSYSDARGNAWDCSDSTAQQVTCEHSGSIAGATGPVGSPVPGEAQELDIDVDVAQSAPAQIATTWAVDTDNDPFAANDTDTDSADVESLDLSIANTHQGTFKAGENGTYKIEVENEGDFATDSTTTVRETLPAGLTYVGATGDGWTCSRVSQDVTCRHTGAIDDGATSSVRPRGRGRGQRRPDGDHHRHGRQRRGRERRERLRLGHRADRRPARRGRARDAGGA